VMSERYRVERGDIAALLLRVDAIPPSLALAQAAEESGWGTSKFARRGNALFGQWTTSSDVGIVPARRDAGKTHKIKAFKSLQDSIAAYMRNLNVHRAYREFRQARHSLRRRGRALDGLRLAAGMTRYSERAEKYVETLRIIINVNRLNLFDAAQLEDSRRSSTEA
jgi:Bax protein